MAVPAVRAAGTRLSGLLSVDCGLVLGDAVDVAAAGEDGPGVDHDNLPVRICVFPGFGGLGG